MVWPELCIVTQLYRVTGQVREIERGEGWKRLCLLALSLQLLQIMRAWDGQAVPCKDRLEVFLGRLLGVEARRVMGPSLATVRRASARSLSRLRIQPSVRVRLSFIEDSAFGQYRGDEGVGYVAPFVDFIRCPHHDVFGRKDSAQCATVTCGSLESRQTGLFNDEQIEVAVGSRIAARARAEENH